MELNINGQPDGDSLRQGDKGYNGDAEGYWVVVASTANWVCLETPDGADVLTIPVAESREQDWRWFRDPAPGQRVRSGAADGGATYGRVGTVCDPSKIARAASLPGRTWIHWDGDVLAKGYQEGHEVLECLQVI